MAFINQYDYRVQPRDIDFTRKISMPALGDYILHAAGENADENGFGTRELFKNNWGWVLARLAIELERPLEQYEHFTVQTWVQEVGRLMTVRNFVLFDARGQEIGGASSFWAMIDMSTRQPVDLSKNLTYTSSVIERESRIAKPVKIRPVQGEQAHEHTIRYSDIDFNQHASSLKYLQWMLDCLPASRFEDRFIRRVDMNFVHEARYGQKVYIHMHDSEATSFEIFNAEKTTVCKALVTWE